MRWDVRNFVILCAGIFYFCHTCDTAGSQAVCQGILQVPCPSYNNSDPTSQLRCIHPSWLCDTEPDCPDGSDEKNCGDCGRDLFRCQEAPYTCIPNSWKCDGEVDCDDGSDESQCKKLKRVKHDAEGVHPENSFPCKPNEIRCAIGLQCIPLEHLCYTDRPECILDDSFCLNFNCLKTDCGSDSWCAETPLGAKCYCESGKTFNETKCVDLDECQFDTYCDQPRLCKNTDPGFTCGCVDGYKLGDDNRSCLAINASGEARFLLLNDGNILQLSAVGTILPRHLYIEDQKATSLTFDYEGDKICLIGHQGGRGEAFLACMTVLDDPRVDPQIIDLLVPSNTSTTLSTVDQVTLDWVTKNWYMTDPHFKRIVVCSRDGTKCKAVLNSTFVSGPKSLAVDPTEGNGAHINDGFVVSCDYHGDKCFLPDESDFVVVNCYWLCQNINVQVSKMGLESYMFFIDWDSPQSYIRRANLDGSDLHIIQGNSSMKSKLIKPTGLTLDYANQHVYWTDRDLNLVSRIDYDGTKKRVIYFGSLVKNVFGISMLQNYLYLTDPFDKTISRVHRYDYNEAPKLLKDSNSSPELTAPQHIEVFHQQRQPSPKWKNPCDALKCEHLCLLTRSPQGQVLAKCECSAGFKLSGNANCSAKPECLSSNSDDYNEGCSLVRCHGDFSYCATSDLCLPSEWWCDGKKDCPDGSDENEYCNYPACEITQFTCKNRRCIDQDFVCDSNDDCGDNSDEVNTACGEMCAFDCKDNLTATSNSTCLKKSQVCDGKPDCVNKLDEKNCDVDKRPCEIKEFQCGDGECIPNTYYCDGDQDCFDGADEANCTHTPRCMNKDQFACTNSSVTLCIPLSWLCDKEKDCPDGADETNCSTTKACEYDLKCQDGSKCLNFSELCDGNKTCSDGTDEGGNCSKNECGAENGGCSDNCTNTPRGHICHCPTGKKLNQIDKTKCIAENPCEQWGICSQTCILDAKAVNGYRCNCSNGYLEPDNYTCKPLESDPVYVVFSNRHEIRRVDVMTNSYVSLIAGLRNTIALDFYYNDGKVYLFWTDVMDDKIYSGTMMGNGITNIVTVIDSGLATTEGLAVDWVGGNIYWVESNLDQIEVAKLDGSLRTTLVAGDMVSPRAIVVDPSHGALFWTDWDGLNPRIEGCSMSGEGRKDIYRIQPKEGGGWPNGLTLDYDFSRLYWIDARSESVHSIKYDGSDYRLILKDHKDMSHPFAISLFGIHFYWTDWSTNSVVRANKFTGGDIKTIQQTVTQPFDLQVVHPLRQPRSNNPCKKSNGKCSHLCLLSYNGTVGCHCPHQKKLDPKDNKTCIDDNKFLLFVRSAEVRGVDLENAHYNVIPVITIPHVDNPSSIDFDQSDGLYWADTGLNVINRANVNGSDVETIIDSGLMHPEGLAIDWISGNIYFSSYDDKSASISVATLNGAFRTEIIKTETFLIAQPHSLAVHPTKGFLFWADKMNKTKLFKSNMDGSQPDIFVDGLTNPQSLAVDMKENVLIFIDDNIIKKCSIDKQTCSQINTSVTTFMPMAVTIHEDYLYVSTSTEHSNIDSIIRFNRDGTGNKTLRSQTPMIKALRVYDKEWRNNGTFKNGCTGKKCSQLCLPVGEMTAVCRCTAGYSLSNNDTSCVGIKSFLMYAKESEIRGISFDKNDSVEALPPISKIQMASAVDFHAATDSIFWADTKANSILRIKRDLSGRETILKDAVSNVEGLAVDWIAGNVYWTDADHDTIEVSRLNGSNRYVLLSGGMEKPRSIAVHPTEGIFFWADWGSEPKIEKACLDGSNRTTFISGINITTPYGLTIDYETNMLYWCDKSLDMIEKVNISTGDRTLIVQDSITDCMSMTVFKDYIYWIDTTDHNGVIKRAKKTDGSSVESIRQSLGTRLRDIKAFDAERQKGTNPCATNNGGCEQLCFYTGKDRPVSCRCSFGKLVNDTHCGEHNNFLLYSRVTAIESIDLDENNKNPPIKPIFHETRLRNVIGLAFDYATQTVFFSDIQRGEIQSIYFNGSGLTTVVEGIGSAEGLSFDSVNKDLYYTSYTKSCISRINVENKPRTSYTVMQMTPRDRLRAITVDSCGGMMYWTNWHDDKPGIHRATLNGLNHEQIISTEIRTPNGLSIDHPAQKLYWSDARLDKIERCNLDGTNRITLITSIPQHSFGLTVYQNYIYWTDWMLRGVLRANKHDGHGVVWLRKNLDRQPMAIIAVAEDSSNCRQNLCYKNQYGCAEKCLLTEMGEPYCECNVGRILSLDRKTCIPDAKCNPGDFTCADGSACVRIEWTCNGKMNCNDSSDEDKAYCKNRTCPLGMFTCSSTRQCIAGYKRCNGEVDCHDLSDENNCTCSSSQFKCNNGRCINVHDRCNRINDCGDFSDEIKALCTGLPPCPEGTWSCSTTTDCVPLENVCDKKKHCMDGSDENITCSEKDDCKGDFKCTKSGECIAMRWKCDKDEDCEDGSDENNCTYHCHSNEFQCKNGHCIDAQWKCDGNIDCLDASDEVTCSNKTCGENEFRCPVVNGAERCIAAEWKCDGDPDCENGEDESVENGCPLVVCNQDDFQCKNLRCIDKIFLCDHDDDCGDRSDEPETCIYQPCKADQFQCNNGMCIDKKYRCDGNFNCTDKSDEWNCTTCDALDKFLCNNSKCISENMTCDGKDDCGDNSDEPVNCNVAECDTFPCNTKCVEKKIGYLCTCDPGYELGPDNKTCQDRDECAKDYPCTHYCHNIIGSYYCTCADGFFLLPDRRRCKDNSSLEDQPFLLVSNRYYIRKIYLDGSVELLLDHLNHSVAIDYDYREKKIYWSDITSQFSSINRRSFNCNNTVTKNCIETLHSTTVRNPDGIAVDWIGRNLYWCDRNTDTVEVSKLDGRFRKILINDPEFLREPRALQVFPAKGYMFLTDWGDKPHISRVGMDGSSKLKIIQDEIAWPNALTIDYVTEKIFWADAYYDYMAMADLDGSNRHVIMRKDLPHIFAMTTFINKIFWTDWETKSIYQVNKFSGEDRTKLATLIHRPMDIVVYHHTRQEQFKSPCEKKNCTHLCLLQPPSHGSGVQAVCACPENHNLIDGRSCSSNCTSSQILCEKSSKCIPFWWRCDNHTDCEDGSDEPPSCPKYHCLQPGMYQCNNATSQDDCLPAMQICDGTKDCKDGSDEDNCKNYTCMSHQFKCVTENICISDTKLCNGATDCKDGADEKNCPNITCQDNQFQCVASKKCIPYLWYCDKDNDCLDWSDEPSNCHEAQCKENFIKCNISGRCILKEWQCDGDVDCGTGDESDEDHSTCHAQTCDPTFFKCRNNHCIPGRWRCDYDKDCTDGSDEDNCEYRNCSESEFQCNNNKCIPRSLQCNHKMDCEDGSDEINCTMSCLPSQFQCADKLKCISESWRCDGDEDCYDASDEMCGANRTCGHGEFRCANSICISSTWQCDGDKDCLDESDEDVDMCKKYVCPVGTYQCKNQKRCVHRLKLCDGNDDCGDMTDEDPRICRRKDVRCVDDEFHCPSSFECLPMYKVCDGKEDCVDKQDENKTMCNKTKLCGSNRCHHNCTDIIGVGMKCSCRHGYVIGDNGVSCTKIDPCSNWRMCPQRCNRTQGWYKCICDSGYLPVVTDYQIKIGQNSTTIHSCMAKDDPPHLLVAQENTLQHLDVRKELINGTNFSMIRGWTIDFEDVQEVNKIEGIDVDVSGDKSTWIAFISSRSSKSIKAISIEDLVSGMNRGKRSTPSATLIVEDLQEPRGIAVDWIGKFLYFVDSGAKKIYMVQYDGSKKISVVSRDLSEPFAIAVDPRIGRMYWTDRGLQPKIEMANLAGQNRTVLVNRNLLWPSGLAIDYPNRRLYWTDLKMNRIETVNLDGSDRQISHTFQSSDPPYMLDIFEDYLYVTTYRYHQLLQIHKFYNASNEKKILFNSFPIGDIVIAQKYKQQNVPNYCAKSNCSKSQCINLPADNPPFACICPTGALVGQDKCEFQLCPENYCNNNGSCSISNENFKCKCPPTHKGVRCEIVNQEYCQNYCYNGGNCSIVGTTRQCTCPLGYMGPQCEGCTQSNTNPCRNGGICTFNGTNTPKCICLPGYSPSDYCGSLSCDEYCLNGGTCLKGSKNLTCACPIGYKGTRCDEADKDCTKPGNICQNGGTCDHQNTITPGICKCPKGFKGSLCESLSCDDYCENGGTCAIENQKLVCKCSPYFNGSRCETCVCIHGNCSTEKNTTCICNRLYESQFCNVSVCRNYCLNGGECVNCTVNKETFVPECQECICKQGTTGSRCTTTLPQLIEIQQAGSELAPIVIPVLVAILVLLAIVGFVIFRRRRNNQFRHHLMKGNADLEVSNPMYAPQGMEEEEDESRQPFDHPYDFDPEKTTNFANPMYETFFSDSTQVLLAKDDDDNEEQPLRNGIEKK